MSDQRGESRAIFRWMPGLVEAVPWVSLARPPTPVESRTLVGIHREGPDGEILVKRDDLSGVPYGGNKVRKLEFLLARARADGAGRILTAGGTGSHHALATALYAGRMGWPVTVVLSPQPDSQHGRAVYRAIQETGAEIRSVPRGEDLAAGLEEEARRHAPQRPFTVPPGGSDAVGSLGYLSAALELGEQLDEAGTPWPERIYLPAGTLGTTAGLALGLELLRAPARIVGVRVVGRQITNRDVLQGLLGDCAALVAPHAEGVPQRWPEAAEDRVEIRDGYLGEGYGHPTDAGERAAEIFRSAGLTLDPTYTAKAGAALLDDLREADSEHPSGALFWHTLSAVMP